MSDLVRYRIPRVVIDGPAFDVGELVEMTLHCRVDTVGPSGVMRRLVPLDWAGPRRSAPASDGGAETGAAASVEGTRTEP